VTCTLRASRSGVARRRKRDSRLTSHRTLSHTRRHAYNTRSNKIMKKRLPGGGLGISYVKKTTKGAQTPAGDNGRIHGVRV